MGWCGGGSEAQVMCLEGDDALARLIRSASVGPSTNSSTNARVPSASSMP
jgi:hypothetical protein